MKRADLIKALNRLKIETGSIVCLGCGHEHNCGTQGCALIRAAIDALQTPPWIPVTENEPPTNTTLLLSVRDPNFGLLYTTCGHQGARWHDIFDLPIDQERITHWMLLPEPPEGAHHPLDAPAGAAGNGGGGMSNWIHVADALPEMLLAGTYKDTDGTEIDFFESRPVLAYNGAYHIVRRNKSAEEGRFYWSDDGGDVEGVTHWMSLPRPPEEA